MEGAIRVPDLVKELDAFDAGFFGNLFVRFSRCQFLFDVVGAGTTEYNDIKEGVSSKTVGSVDRHASSLARSVEPRDNIVFPILVDGQNLARVLGWNTTHYGYSVKGWQASVTELTVIVDGGQHGDRFLCHIDTSKDGCGLRDTRKTFVQDLWGEMAELQEDVILLGTDTTTFADFDGHTAGDDITRSQIFGGGGITFHETLPFGVQKVPSFTTRT